MRGPGDIHFVYGLNNQGAAEPKSQVVVIQMIMV